MNAGDPGGPEKGRYHGKLDQFFQWLGGYSPKNLTFESPESCEPIAKFGGAVLFAALVASVNWATAAFSFASKSGLAVAAVAAVLAATVAISMVCAVDRATIYVCDSMPMRRIPMTLWIVLRAAIIFAIGGVTAQQALIPLILEGPLQAHALNMRETADARRVAELGNRYDIVGKKDDASAATAKLLKLESESIRLPANIQAHLTEARRCWSDYAGRKKILLDRGEAETSATMLLRAVARRCAHKQKLANDEKERHETILRLKHDDAVAQKIAADAALESATTALATRTEEARAIEKTAINPHSPTVLADLLATDPGAKATWLICTFLLVAMELLPLIGKLLVGKSPIGHRLSTDRAIDSMALDERLAQATRDVVISREIANSMQGAIVAACKDPQIAEICTNLFSKKITSLMPLEMVHAFLGELERIQFDAEKAMRRNPRHAPFIIEMVTDAVREAGQILKSATPVHDNRTWSHQDQKAA